jgi:hypothetical protein
MTRWLLPLLVAMLGACREEAPVKPALKVSHDAQALAARVTLPFAIAEGHWAVKAVGEAGGVPGPSDTVLYAFVVAADAGAPPAGAASEIRVPEEVAIAILPGSVLASGRKVGADIVVTGTREDPAPFSRVPYHGSKALRLGFGVLLVLHTR